MLALLVCQKISYRNSSSSRGVVVATGVIQCGCSACVLSTRSNQSAKYPPPDPLWLCCADNGRANKNNNAGETTKLRKIRTNRSLGLEVANPPGLGHLNTDRID